MEKVMVSISGDWNGFMDSFPEWWYGQSNSSFALSLPFLRTENKKLGNKLLYALLAFTSDFGRFHISIEIRAYLVHTSLWKNKQAVGEYKMHQCLELGNLDLPSSSSQKKQTTKQTQNTNPTKKPLWFLNRQQNQ